MDRPAAFLDRDGTINVDKGYLYRPEECEYLEGALEGLRLLGEMGYLLVIITNQSGIARGYYKEEDYRRFMAWMVEDLKNHGIHIAGTYFCPHFAGGRIHPFARECNCRKPATGLFYKAKEELGIDMDRSVAVGDKIRDLSICKNTGVKGMLLGKEAVQAEFDYELCDGWNEVIKALKGTTVI